MEIVYHVKILFIIKYQWYDANIYIIILNTSINFYYRNKLYKYIYRQKLRKLIICEFYLLQFFIL